MANKTIGEQRELISARDTELEDGKRALQEKKDAATRLKGMHATAHLVRFTFTLSIAEIGRMTSEISEQSSAQIFASRDLVRPVRICFFF